MNHGFFSHNPRQGDQIHVARRFLEFLNRGGFSSPELADQTIVFKTSMSHLKFDEVCSSSLFSYVHDIKLKLLVLRKKAPELSDALNHAINTTCVLLSEKQYGGGYENA